MNEQDIAKMAIDFACQHSASIKEIGSELYKNFSRELLLRLEGSYKKYLIETSQKYSKTKSFFIRNSPAWLYDFYIPIAISQYNTRIEKPDFSNIINISNKIVITGTGGSGKSILMRHLLLSCINFKKFVPIFIELKKINQNKSSLKDLIYDELNSEKYSFDTKYIDKAIRIGHFAFFLDGFDEISNELRSKLITDITNLATIGDKCPIIISSRPDEVFCGIDRLDILQIESLTLGSACALVEKLPYDSEIKKQFINELNNGMYKTHSSFLSNPLLLSIMLLTYGQNAQIPSKLSIFYNQAYEALFQRHDALKCGYKRERCTNLDIQDFAKVFSVFCLQTYDKRQFEFSRIEALEYINKSKQHLSLNFKNEHYLEDLLKSTCLMIEDGINITFSHRSFQEYFVAYYINNSSPEIQEKLISKYRQNIKLDSTLVLLYEINPGLIERVLIIPCLTKIYQNIGVTKKVGITHALKYLKTMYQKATISNNKFSLTYKKSKATDVEILHYLIRTQKLYNADQKIYFTRLNNIIKLYGNNKSVEFDTSTLTINSLIAKDLANSYGIVSIYYLQIGYEKLLSLKEKYNNIESSLDQLLRN